MNIDSIAPVATEIINVTEIKNQSVDKSGLSFSDYITQYYNDVNANINEADTNLREYAVGNNNNILEIMLSVEKAKTEFELGLQIRNRVLEAYQELMRMQM